MSTPALKLTNQTERYTYADYATWPDHPRYELIEGEAIKMEAPSQAHQGMLVELVTQFRTFLRGKKCKVYAAPFDVRLNHKTLDNTVVQPDLLVVCDMDKLNGKHCLGAPDMVLEILSPSTTRKDQFVKFHIYQKAGVKEFWILDPLRRTTIVYVLQNNVYTAMHYSDVETIPVHVLEGCEINLAEVFAEAPPLEEPDRVFPPELQQ